MLQAPDRLTTPLVRGDDGELSRPRWDEALDLVAAALRGIRERARADAVAVFGGGGLTNEKAYQLGKFARVALGTANIDYNGRFCMSSAAAAGEPVPRGGPRPAVPADRPRRRATRPAARQQRRRDHAAVRAAPRGRRARAGSSWSTPAAAPRPTYRGRPGPPPPAGPGHRPRLPARPAHVVLAEGLADAAYVADAHHRARGAVAAASRLVARAGRARARRPGRPICAPPPACWPRPARTRRRRRVHPHRPRRRAVTPRARPPSPPPSTSRSPLGLPGTPGLRLRRPHRPGQRPGRSRARPEGRPAPRLPDDRRPGRACARRGGVGRRPGRRCPARACPPSSCSTRSAPPAGRGRCCVHGSQPWSSAPPTPGRRASGCAASTSSWSATSCPSETAQLADVVLPVTQWAEEEGTMTNLEGRVLRRRARRRPARGCPQRAGDAGRARRAPGRARHVRDRPARWSSTSSPRQRRRAGRLLRHQLRAARRRATALFWPCPPRDGPHPGTPRLFADALRHPGRHGPASCRVDHRRPADDAGAGRPDLPGHRPGPAALPVRRPDPAGRRARRPPSPAPFVEIHPSWPTGSGVAEGERWSVTSRRGRASARPASPTPIRPDTVFVPFHWAGAGSVNRLTNDALDPDPADARVQGLRVGVRPARLLHQRWRDSA